VTIAHLVTRHVRGQQANPFSWAAVRAALEADVLHCHQQHIVATTVTAIAGRLRGRRVFCTDLGGGGWDLSGYVSTDRVFHGHLHISEYSRRVFGHEHLATARVILGGVDTEKFSPAPDVPRDLDCVYVGRLLPHKGVDRLIEAMPDDLELSVAGPAPDARYLADLHALAERKRVRFVHDASDEQVVELYRRARVVVLPSLYRDRYGHESRVPELLGQTLIEAMSSGAAAICTDVASMPEVVVDGVTGVVVPPDNPAALGGAVRWMHEHPAEAAAMGVRGRQRVLERFTWNAVVDRCLQAYAQ
jgi:glycosyltransferase involved in cell wall biosynthesis